MKAKDRITIDQFFNTRAFGFGIQIEVGTKNQSRGITIDFWKWSIDIDLRKA